MSPVVWEGCGWELRLNLFILKTDASTEIIVKRGFPICKNGDFKNPSCSLILRRKLKYDFSLCVFILWVKSFSKAKGIISYPIYVSFKEHWKQSIVPYPHRFPLEFPKQVANFKWLSRTPAKTFTQSAAHDRIACGLAGIRRRQSAVCNYLPRVSGLSLL